MLYKQINKEERFCLAYFLDKGIILTDIALKMDRSISSLSREISRNTNPVSGKYLPGLAHRLSQERQANRNKVRSKITGNKNLELIIEKLLWKGLSPEQIKGRLDEEKNISLTHETIYRWIYVQRKDLIKYLRHYRKRRYRRRYGTKIREKEREKSKKRSIDTRPETVDTRKYIGHWEGDTIVGPDRKHSIVTLVERKSRLTLAKKVDSRKAIDTALAIIELFRTVPKKKRISLTLDNGVEFSNHWQVEERTGTTI